MGKFSKRVTRDWFPPKTVLDELSIKGRIGGEEAKRLLEESCHAYIRVCDKLCAMERHIDDMKKLTGGFLKKIV